MRFRMLIRITPSSPETLRPLRRSLEHPRDRRTKGPIRCLFGALETPKTYKIRIVDKQQRKGLDETVGDRSGCYHGLERQDCRPATIKMSTWMGQPSIKGSTETMRMLLLTCVSVGITFVYLELQECGDRR